MTTTAERGAVASGYVCAASGAESIAEPRADSCADHRADNCAVIRAEHYAVVGADGRAETFAEIRTVIGADFCARPFANNFADQIAEIGVDRDNNVIRKLALYQNGATIAP